MSVRVIWRDEAIAELQEAYDRCEKGTSGSGERLLEEVDEFVDFLRVNPRSFPKWRGEFQKVTLQHFPYMIIYKNTDDALVILSVYHSSRDDRGWGKKH